jgi:ketosteroid isomerase-like protein
MKESSMAVIDGTVGIDPERLRFWADRFLDAWNASDAAGVAALCTEDVVWTDPSAPEPFAGRAGVREFVRLTVDAFPDLHIVETSPPRWIPASATVLSPYRMTGTMLGPMDVFAPTGRRVCVDGVDEWTFRGELLCGYRTYYDTIDAARQLGIMPEPGSRAERLMSRFQHIQALLQRHAARPDPRQ